MRRRVCGPKTKDILIFIFLKDRASKKLWARGLRSARPSGVGDRTWACLGHARHGDRPLEPNPSTQGFLWTALISVSWLCGRG